MTPEQRQEILEEFVLEFSGGQNPNEIAAVVIVNSDSGMQIGMLGNPMEAIGMLDFAKVDITSSVQRSREIQESNLN